MKFDISQHKEAIFWSILSSLLLSIMLAFARYAADSGYHPFQIVFLRNLIAILFFLPWLLKNGVSIIETEKTKLHITRATIGVAAMLLWFYAIANMPLAEAMAISFTGPIFTVITAMIFLNEKMNLDKWLAIIASFAGTMIIIRPGFSEVSIYAYIVLLSTFLWAFASIVIKNLTKTESANVITFYMVAFMTPMSLPFALIYWQNIINFTDLFIFVVIALTSNLSHIALSNAYAKADLTVLMPFEFARLLFIAIIAYFAFGDILDFWTLTGAIVIVFSSFYIARKEGKKRKIQITQTIKR